MIAVGLLWSRYVLSGELDDSSRATLVEVGTKQGTR